MANFLNSVGGYKSKKKNLSAGSKGQIRPEVSNFSPQIVKGLSFHVVGNPIRRLELVFVILTFLAKEGKKSRRVKKPSHVSETCFIVFVPALKMCVSNLE